MERRDDLVGSARTATGRPDTPASGADNAAAGAAPAAGGAAGAIAGGTAGTIVAGPVGTIIGAIAGAIGGWWMGAAARRVMDLTPEEEAYYRAHYDAAPRRDWTWERARPAYELGHIAAANPDYAGRPFADVEGDLQHGWRGETRATYGDWSAVREMARAAYERRSASNAAAKRADDIGTSPSHQRAPFADPLPDAAELAGASGHPGIAGGPGDIPEPSSASRTGQPLPRPDIGPHAPDATGGRDQRAP